ncbi:MAG: hypothetical protein B6D61_06285 [Bacteroidetes bacterium 4484_249]|nr:MAG: hypothetical protein B6D61_06285 [Bacteroidetes bacterium 4484_249]
MRNTFTFILIGFASLFFITDGIAQDVNIYGVFRPRFENRHGYNTIFPEGSQAANFISQRSRLGLKFSNDKFKVGFSIQNVGVWGETGTLSKSDINGTAVHEAWGEILFSEKFSVKAGRQEIIYDDHRIFGSVDWAQQGRSHDALIFKIRPRKECQLDIGFAYNAKRETLLKEDYFTNNYKTFQYAHWHRNFNELGVSVLLLNNGMSYINSHDTTDLGVAKENVAYTQTIGPRLTYKKNKFSANAAFYYQMGKRTNLNVPVDTLGNTIDTTMKVGAMYFALNVAFQLNEMFSVGAGVEYLSGNNEKKIADNKGIKETERAFAPLYGTNHKFNGWMDYFYVGNHFNSVGLMDIYIPLKFKKDKFSAMLIPHFFSTAGQLYRQERDDKWTLKYNDDGTPMMKELKKGLGTEIDLAFGFAFSKSVILKAGYSFMLASESMEYLKGTQKDKGNTWGWVMLIFKPTFYSSK